MKLGPLCIPVLKGDEKINSIIQTLLISLGLTNDLNLNSFTNHS